MNATPNSPFLLVLLMMSFLFTFSCTARHDVLVAADVGSQKSDGQYYAQVGKVSSTRTGLIQWFSKLYLGEGKVPRRITQARYPPSPPICYYPPCHSSGTGRNAP
nr:hypothetical protein Iba_chr12bCG12770 [Ipomoea batatas]